MKKKIIKISDCTPIKSIQRMAIRAKFQMTTISALNDFKLG